jgi:glycosyltransferase A (GT-A) superfamily protein (DUF2064 family)
VLLITFLHISRLVFDWQSLDMPMRLLLVFVNEPTPGLVNTRLAVDVGENEAARLYKAMVEVLLRQLQGLQDCRIRFCYAPDDAGDAVRFWLLPSMQATSSAEDGLYIAPQSGAGGELTQEVDFRPQGNGNFGERVSRAFSDGFDQGYREIALVGTNCIECGSRWINAAFSRLLSESARDAVIGPTVQGSYYLLALKSHAPELFENIPWGEEDVFTATMSAARRSGLYVDSLPRLTEVLELDNWQELMKSSLGGALKKALGEPLEETFPWE